ncbi:MAG: patatin family protein [Firmicutes bacterium]|nr:patatin family protein [Bacillota bacterium]
MKVCLVLEGGAMRGLYTAGILDALVDTDIKIDCIIGVSAGALFGVNYKSKQKGRVLRYNTKYANDKRYMGLHSLITTGNLVNTEFAYHELPTKLDIFDEEEYSKSKTDFYAVITNINTGKAEYKKIINATIQVDELRASGSMPFVSQPVKIDDNYYLDGALADSIPVLKAKEMGYDKVIVVLTRPKEYRKKKRSPLIAKLFYKKYPNLVEAINTRYKQYNDTLDIIEELEDKKDIYVFRPSTDLKIKRVEKDKSKLEAMYNLGLKDFKDNLKSLKKYLKK